MNGRKVLIGLVCVVMALVAAGCGDDDATTETTAAEATTEETTESLETTEGSAPAKGKESPNQKPQITVPGGPPPKKLVIRDLIKGSGPEAKAGDEAIVDYVGVGYESGKQFDASWDRGESFPFPLGAGSVIKGWDQGVVGMKVGGRRELIIPPGLAYGPEGAPPAIGPGETLIFVIDLRAVN